MHGVSKLCPKPRRSLPAFGYPNIHNWNWLRNAVPMRVVLGRVACVVAGFVLIVEAGLARLGPMVRGWPC